MDRGFFGSREFAIAGVLALLLVAGGAYALLGRGFGHFSESGCDAPRLEGTTLDAAPQRQDASSTERTLAYVLDPAGREAGALDACTVLGDVTVGPSPDGLVHVTFTLDAPDSSALGRTEAQARFRADGPRLGVEAWVGRHGGADSFGDRDETDVSVEVLLPALGAWRVHAESETGDVSVGALLVSDAALESTLGDLEVRGADVAGNVTMETETGAVTLAPASLQTGQMRLASTLGDLVARLPARADAGYEVFAETTVGDVQVDVGEAEVSERADEPGSSTAHVRTAGFAAKPTRVTLRMETETGDVQATAA